MKRLRAVVGDCSTVALLILNLSKAIKQSLGGMSRFNHSAIVKLGKIWYCTFRNIRIFYAYTWMFYIDHVTTDACIFAQM